MRGGETKILTATPRHVSLVSLPKWGIKNTSQKKTRGGGEEVRGGLGERGRKKSPGTHLPRKCRGEGCKTWGREKKGRGHSLGPYCRSYWSRTGIVKAGKIIRRGG